MSVHVRTRIVKIGNSQGIRIPKVLLDQAGLTGEVELEAEAGQLVVRPLASPRHEWDAVFQAMAEAGDDRLLDAELLSTTSWDDSEWTW